MKSHHILIFSRTTLFHLCPALFSVQTVGRKYILTKYSYCSLIFCMIMYIEWQDRPVGEQMKLVFKLPFLLVFPPCLFIDLRAEVKQILAVAIRSLWCNWTFTECVCTISSERPRTGTHLLIQSRRVTASPSELAADVCFTLLISLMDKSHELLTLIFQELYSSFCYTLSSGW